MFSGAARSAIRPDRKMVNALATRAREFVLERVHTASLGARYQIQVARVTHSVHSLAPVWLFYEE